MGDIVEFKGGGVYKSSTAHTPAVTRNRSLCKVTVIAPRARNEYHLVSEDGGNVWGWVVSEDVAAIGGGTPSGAATSAKSVDEIAREVIRGLWGNGQERANRLTAAGHDAGAVQARVNLLVK